MLHLLILLGSYLLGSIPFGHLIARARGIDIMSVGYSVFVLDVLKGVIPAVVATQVLKSQEWSVVCGLTAVVGHSLSPFLKFKGGKGVSTGLGAILGSCPVVALIAFGIFLVLLAMTRYVSLGSLVAAASLPISAGILGYSYTVIGLMAATALLVISRHRGNIERLRNGTERKFNPRGKSSEPSEPPEESEEK
jgi:acyl phosphate:glycerol-3-phosphate acyltransferase